MASIPASSLGKQVPFGRAAVGMHIGPGTAVSWKEQLERRKNNAVSRSNNSPVISDRASVGMEVFLSGAEKESVAVRHCLKKVGAGRQLAGDA